MTKEALDVGMALINFLKVGGPYAIMIIEGYVIYRLWKKNDELHGKLEKLAEKIPAKR